MRLFGGIGQTLTRGAGKKRWGWPNQESMSQLDAAACGLPVVLSNRISVLERVEGNGLLYKEGQPENLARQLQKLADPGLRCNLGVVGAAKVRERYSWLRIARERIADYEAAIQA